jgi:hypothetical protein
MNSLAAPLVIEPSFLGAKLRRRLAAVLAAAAPGPTQAASPRTATAPSRRPATASEPDLWRLYRLAVVMDSVHPSIAAELDRYRASINCASAYNDAAAPSRSVEGAADSFRSTRADG